MKKDQVNFTINKFNEHAEVEYYMIEKDKWIFEYYVFFKRLSLLTCLSSFHMEISER